MSVENPIAKLPKLLDSESVESEVQGSDLAGAAPAASERDEDIVALMEDRFQRSATARRYRDAKIFLPLAFFLGEQHMGWSTNRECLVDGRDLLASWRSYSVRNKIKGKCLKLQARALESQPEPSFRPTLFESELDKGAAAEARAIRAHLCRVHDEDQQISEEVLWSIVTGMCFRKYSWDPTQEADVPDYDAQDNLVGTVRARVGEIARDTIPIVDIYPDPQARIAKGRIERCAWLIHSHVCSLDEVRQRYGDAAMHLDGEVASGRQGYVENRMAMIVGDMIEQGESVKSSVVVKECWEQPSLKYPEGRLFVTCQEKVLRYDEAWPCQKRDSYPFVPRVWHNGLGSFYGEGAVWDAIGAQRTYNIATSAMDQALQYPWGKWLVPRGAEIGVDSLDDPREAVSYAPGMRPEYQPPPEVAAIVLQALQQADRDLDDIFGLHDISDGQAPNGVTAASALESLKQQDVTQLKAALTNIDASVHQDAEWEIALAREYYDTPRLMAVEDATAAGLHSGLQQGSSGGYGQVMDFRALTAGGSCHIVMEAGTRATLSASARLDLIAKLYSQQFFGPVGDPRSSMMALELMNEVRSDGLVERLMAMRQEMQAEARQAQAQQAQDQQSQGQQAQAQQDNQAQNAATLKVLQAHLDQAAKQAQDAQAHQHSAEMEAVRLHTDISRDSVIHAHDIEKLAAAAGHEAKRVNVSLTGKLSQPETDEAFAYDNLGQPIPVAQAQPQEAAPVEVSGQAQAGQEVDDGGIDGGEAQASDSL